MKQFVFLVFKNVLFLFITVSQTFGQQKTIDSTKIRVAVFAPLYLDSSYNGTEYKLTNEYLPKYLLPGLEFYNGVLLALDSLKKDSIPVTVDIYDLKQSIKKLKSIVEDSSFFSTQLIIAAITTPEELALLSKVSGENKIPLISATYPRTSGVEGNSGFVLISSSLITHIEQLYKFIQKNYALDNLVLLGNKGNSSRVIKMLYNNQSKTTASVPLKYKTIDLPDNFNQADIKKHLDSTKLNIIIAGDIDETFGIDLVKNFSGLLKYKTIFIGMPTWNGLKEFNSDIVKGISYVYSTPYNFVQNKNLLQFTQQKYKTQFGSKPSDYALKGFETFYHFARLLKKDSSQFINNLSSNEFTIFTNYDIRPVYNKSANTSINYLENFKIYFITKTDGQIVFIQE